MTIDVDGIKRLMQRNKETYSKYLHETDNEIKIAEDDLIRLKKYKEKLSFYLDKSTKMLEVVEMAGKSKQLFSVTHKHLYEDEAE